jgi:hypothetical protein
MFKLLKPVLYAGVASAVCSATPAAAAAYVFDVNYNGGGNAVLASGSDDPLTTVINVGDSFTYNLQAANGGFWTVLSATNAFAAVQVTPCGTRNSNFSYTYSNNGTSVASAASVRGDGCVHIGELGAPLAAGLQFDKLTLTATILAGSSPSTLTSLLPFAGAPEANQNVRYTVGNAVPEPATWAMLIVGFGMVGSSLRRRRTGYRVLQPA